MSRLGSQSNGQNNSLGLVNSYVSSESYATLVAGYVKHAIGTSIFTGELFEGLANFLGREFDQAQQVEVDIVVHILPVSVEQDSANPLIYLNTLELDQAWKVLSATDSNAVSADSSGFLVFMRGHQPPECLTRIGAMCKINPLFFQRHLEYRWSSRPLKLFSSPSLPSTSFNTIRLHIFTLGERMESAGLLGTSQLQALRTKSEAAMRSYMHDVTREYKLEAGNSIVRYFNLHNSQFFSIEQEVTVTVKKIGNKWMAMIWTDIGHDLGSGPEGPWRPDRSRSTPRKSPFLPTIQNFPANAAIKLSKYEIPEEHQSRGPFAQSASLLAKSYGMTLDPALLAVDSFYALTELFQNSANSICQLLNLVESIIDQSTGYNLYKSQDYSLANLSYHQDILNRLQTRLRENVFDLDNHQSVPWPTSYDDNDPGAAHNHAKAAATARLLLTDFQRLLSRSEHLSERCQSGMMVCMNSAAIAESQRAIAQAQQVEQLTRLAFFYIPLSFTTSFFGMNLSAFGTGNLRLWTWFASSIPLVLISYIILAWLSRYGGE